MNRYKMIGIVCIIALIAVFSFVVFGNITEKPKTNHPVESFSLPPFGEDPYTIIEKYRQEASALRESRKNDPKADTLIGTIYPSTEMRGKNGTVDLAPTIWLANSQSFRGLWSLETYFPASLEYEELGLKAFLNTQEINISVDGSSFTSFFRYKAKRGEAKILTLETSDLPNGVHSLRFVIFRHLENESTNPLDWAALGSAITTQPFKVYIGTTLDKRGLENAEWSNRRKALPNPKNLFEINDGTLNNDGFPLWQPEPLALGKKSSYTVTINNAKEENREYCLLALLNYQQINLHDDKKEFCGVVKSGELIQLNAEFEAPSIIGKHRLQVLRFENPLMREEYAQKITVSRSGGVTSTSRVLIEVTK